MSDEYISILLLCFNSSFTVKKTLDSIEAQDYQNLDLIISDDCSSDNTLHIINKWIEKHRNRFRNIKLNINEENKGINYSFHNALLQSKTRWVKFIAGDDVLMKDCVSKCYKYIIKNQETTLLYSKVVAFSVINETVKKIKENKYEIFYVKKIAMQDAQKQYRLLLKRDMLFSPTGFINVDIYRKTEGISLRIRNIEDWALRLLFTSEGYKISFMDEYTVFYRVGQSVSHDNKCMYNAKHLEEKKKLKRELIYPNISKRHIIYYFCEKIEDIRYYLIIHKLKNNKNIITKIINYGLMIFDLNKMAEIKFRIFHR